MILIDENMSVKEVRKEFDEILKPVKDFNDLWGVSFQYDDNSIKTDAIEAHLDLLISYLHSHDNVELRKFALEKIDVLDII